MKLASVVMAIAMVAGCLGSRGKKAPCPGDLDIVNALEANSHKGAASRDDLRACAGKRVEKLTPQESLDTELPPAYTKYLVAHAQLDEALADANKRIAKKWNYGLANWVISSGTGNSDRVLADCKRLHAAAPAADKQPIMIRCEDALTGITTDDALEFLRATQLPPVKDIE